MNQRLVRRRERPPSQRYHASIALTRDGVVTTLIQDPLDIGSVENVISMRLLDVKKSVFYALLETRFGLDFFGWTPVDIEVTAP
jgi:hypothetical protein